MKTYKRQALISFEEFHQILQEYDEADLFSMREIKLYGKKKGYGSYAARFALKKTLQEMLKLNFSFPDIEILNNEHGKPELHFSDALQIKLSEAGIMNIHISISHSKKRAAMLVIIEES